MAKGYPSDWDSRRRAVYKRDGYTCQNCGAQGGPYGNTELNAHHIVPKSKGGTHSKNNLVTICKPCHNAVHYNQQTPPPTQHQAPTQPQQNQNIALQMAEKDDLDQAETFFADFGETCIEAADFVENLGGDLAILSDGTLEDDTLEEKRVDLLQQLGTIDFQLEGFEGDYRLVDDIEIFINSLISLFITFENVGEIIEDDSKTASEKRQLIEPKLNRRIQQVRQDSQRVKRSLDDFNRQVGEAQKAVEAEQKSSSFLSRLFNF
ncbi:HNH endonuclease [Halalkalicoccus ordinarius]|uniref:HNH endonuclease n=1 Tax=Halalkalicoccus ordinarius TaxID=3116651 RepID=UPI00300F4428